MLLSNLVTTVRHARARISGSECSSRATRSLDSILCLGARDYSSGSAGGGPGMRGELAFTSAKDSYRPFKKNGNTAVCVCVQHTFGIRRARAPTTAVTQLYSRTLQL